MKTIFFDTSTDLLYFCVLEDTKVLYEVKTIGKNNHSDHLLDEVKKALKNLNLEVKDFDRIVVGIGPGAYTGLRVSLTVAKMFAWTLNIKLYTISSLDLLSSDITNDGKYVIKFRAKKDHSYVKYFKVENGLRVDLSKESFMNDQDINTYNYQVINHDDININVLNIKDDDLTLIENIHALEPNYLRDC